MSRVLNINSLSFPTPIFKPFHFGKQLSKTNSIIILSKQPQRRFRQMQTKEK